MMQWDLGAHQGRAFLAFPALGAIKPQGFGDRRLRRTR